MKLVATLLLVAILSACSSKKPKYKTGLEGKLMPTIDLKLIDTNSHFSTMDITPGRPSILFAFEPWCPYCKAQTKAILSNIETLKNIDFYFITNSTYPLFKEFSDRYQLKNYPNIKAGIDYNYSFARYFKSSQIPYLAVYDKDKRLRQVLMGKNYISTIKQVALN